ncbi:hypothetical protein FS837_007461 [Tulasnella sp. UAMH 9824]|nr:hypothetical protein FS837_007461 [Tulasnella sp. UAMH 9824]
MPKLRRHVCVGYAAAALLWRSISQGGRCTALPDKLRTYLEIQDFRMPVASNIPSLITSPQTLDPMIFPERDAKITHDARSDSGITSLSALTDTTVKSDTSAQEPVLRQDSGDANPPPYNTPGPSSPPSSNTPSARVNHLHLVRQGDSVSGRYTVDLDLVVPPQHLPNLADGEGLENLKLVSNNSNVSADVVLIGQEGKRASLVAESKHGNVKINLLSRGNCPFRLLAKSSGGTVTIYLPRNFIGPFTSSTENGGLDLSDAVKQNYTPFSEDRLAAKGFIGDWSSSGYGDIDVVQAGTEGTGDELFASSKWGRVKVFYTDELNAAGGGFFSSWFRGFT